MTNQLNQEATETQQDRRVKLTRFVHPSTVKKLESLEVIYCMKGGRIIDRLVQTLMEARTMKTQHCISGMTCRFQEKFPETNIL